jgi:DNA-binding MarR family transcriptional regulator
MSRPTKSALQTAHALFSVVLLAGRLTANAARERGTVSPERARALLRLAEAPLRTGELAQRCLLTPPAMTELVDTLVREGLVRRREDPSDRRAVLVSLTPAGRREVERYQVLFSGVLGEAIAELEPAARERLRLALSDLRQGLERAAAQREIVAVR